MTTALNCITCVSGPTKKLREEQSTGAEIANIDSTFEKARRKGFERFYHKGKMIVHGDGWA